ncbi:MAG: hypothetical protein AABY22_27830 [Nanoarchaeota archaeon]
MTNEELFNKCMKEAKGLLSPHIEKADPGDDNLLIELAYILFEHELRITEK